MNAIEEQQDLPPEGPPPKTYEDGLVDAVTIVSACGIIYAAYQIWYVIPKFTDIFKSLRVDLPLPTQLTVWISHNTSLSMVFLGISIIALELVRRTRSVKLAVVVMIAAICAGPIANQSVMLPIFKIQDQLRKK